jgi:hypothetical protein
MQSSSGFTKSMSGVVEITDGAGTIIEDGEVETNKIITNNIQGKAPSNAITLYTNTTGNVDLRTFRFGNNTITTTQLATLPVSLFTNQTDAGNIIIGNSQSRVFASSFRFRDNLMTVEFPTTLVNLFTTQSGTGSITIGNAAVRVRTSGCIFQNDTLNLLTPSNTASLFTTQTNSINIGNASISTNIGNFRFTNDVLTSTSTGLISLFPDNLGNLVIGNIYKLVQVARFVFYNSTLFISNGSGLLELFVNHNGNIIFGNRFININIGTFNFSNKKITTTAPTELLTLFDTQSGGITLGNASGTLEMKASILNVKTPILNVSNNGGYFEITAESNLIWMDFHSNSSFFTDYDARISSTGGTASTAGGTLDLIAATTNITSPTTTINAATSATITSPTTTINAATKVDITTPNLNVKASNGNYLEVLTEGNDYVRLDFHSNSLYTTDYDSRIASTGGTASTAGGTLNLASGTINFNNATTVNSNTPKFNLVYGGNSLELAAGGNNVYLDFHSNSSFSTDYDSRIIGYGGTAVNGNGAIAIQTNDLNLVAPNVYIRSNLFRYVPPTTYVPTLSTGTCPTRRGSYSITGSMMTVHITFTTLGFGTGTAGSGIYGFGIPTGFTIRTVAYGSIPSNGEVQLYDPATGTTGDMSGTSVGNGYLQVRGLSMATTCVVPFTNNTLAVYGSSQTAGITNWHGSTYYQFSYSNLVESFSATFPIN